MMLAQMTMILNQVWAIFQGMTYLAEDSWLLELIGIPSRIGVVYNAVPIW